MSEYKVEQIIIKYVVIKDRVESNKIFSPSSFASGSDLFIKLHHCLSDCATSCEWTQSNSPENKFLWFFYSILIFYSIYVY